MGFWVTEGRAASLGWTLSGRGVPRLGVLTRLIPVAGRWTHAALARGPGAAVAPRGRGREACGCVFMTPLRPQPPPEGSRSVVARRSLTPTTSRETVSSPGRGTAGSPGLLSRDIRSPACPEGRRPPQGRLLSTLRRTGCQPRGSSPGFAISKPGQEWRPAEALRTRGLSACEKPRDVAPDTGAPSGPRAQAFLSGPAFLKSAVGEREGSTPGHSEKRASAASAPPAQGDAVCACAPRRPAPSPPRPAPPARGTLGRPGPAARRLVAFWARLRLIDGAGAPPSRR